MAWDPNDRFALDNIDLDKKETPANFDRTAPPIIKTVEQQIAQTGASRRLPRAKGQRGLEVTPNEPISLPSGATVVFTIMRLPINKCVVWEGNQRSFDALTAADVEDIASSVATSGVLVPVVARPTANGWEIIDGSRRYFTAKLTGTEYLPAFVGEISDEDCYYLTALYNNYEKPSYYEIGLFVQRVRDKAGSKFASVEFTCSYLGITERTYYRTLHIAELPRFVLDHVTDPRSIPLSTGSDLSSAIAKLRDAGREAEAAEAVIAVTKKSSDDQLFLTGALKALTNLLKSPEKPAVPKLRATVVKNKSGKEVMKVLESKGKTLKIELLTEMEVSLGVLEQIKKILGCV